MVVATNIMHIEAPETWRMKAAVLAAALSLLAGCAFPDAQVRKRAANDFSCHEDEIVLHHIPSGYLARGCKKEADYLVQNGGVSRISEIRKAAFDERPPVPIDRTAQNRLNRG